MSPLPVLNEGDLDLLVSYSLDADEEICEAVVRAFLAANIDVFAEPTTLVDWVNTDVFEDLRWSTDGPLYLCTRIWRRQVVITAEEVRIYTASVLT